MSLTAFVAVALASAVAATAATAAAPPGRAYEKVTPVGKGGGEVLAVWNTNPLGNAATFTGLAAFDDSGGGVSLISEYSGIRGPAGWSIIDRNPVTRGSASLGAAALPQAMTADYQRMVFTSSGPYSADDTNPFDADFFIVDNALNVQLLTKGVPDADGPDAANAAGGAMSADAGHFAFQVAPIASPNDSQVYDRTGGATRLVSLDPSGNPLPNAVLGAGRVGGGLNGSAGTFSDPSAMSTDGSRIFFSDGTSLGAGGATPRNLYVRENGTSTTLVSEGQGGPRDGLPSDQDVDFQMATADGGRVFFKTTAQLTADATVGGGLYRYDLDSGDLTFISSGSTDPAGAGFRGLVRISADGSIAYFVANDMLATGATLGLPNLYRADAGGITFVATLSDSDSTVWGGDFFGAGEAGRLAKLTPDGNRLVFQSVADLTPDQDGGNNQIYLYDAASGDLSCVSCPPAGVTPIAPGGTLDEQSPSLNFNTIPGDITDDGSTILFQSSDRVVPSDTNSVADSYLWVNGTRYLLGSGDTRFPGVIGGISDDGQDVFFLTRDSLLPVDTDGGEMDVYDARRGGGLAAQQVVPAEPCSGEECKPPPASTAFTPPGSADFSGKGNLEGEAAAAFVVKPISASARRKLARTGKATLLVRVSEGGRVSVEALAKFGKRTRKVGSDSKRAKKAGTVRLHLKLSKAARSRLRETGRLKLTIRVSYSEVAKRATAHVTLRRNAR